MDGLGQQVGNLVVTEQGDWLSCFNVVTVEPLWFVCTYFGLNRVTYIHGHCLCACTK